MLTVRLATLARAALVIGCVAGLAGCAGIDSTLIQALAQDKNALCIKSVLNGPGFSITSEADRNWGCEAPPAKVVAVP